jgi:RNA polymerase sigma factor (sigma-70 family)
LDSGSKINLRWTLSEQNGKSVSIPANATGTSESLLTVFIVDDDPLDRDRLAILLGRCGYRLRLFPSAEAFLEAAGPGMVGCMVADLRLPRMSGLELLAAARAKALTLPFLVVSAYGDINSVRQVFHYGAVDFLEKPVATPELLAAIEKCFQLERQRIAADSVNARRGDFLDALSERERQVATLAARGNSNREVGEQLGISHRTVEVHKARIMGKLGIRSTAELIRLASQLDIAGEEGPAGDSSD